MKSQDRRKTAVTGLAEKDGEGTLLLLAVAAIVGRLFFWDVPSVEPVIPLAVFAALTINANAGIIVGAAGYLGSNLPQPYELGEWAFWQSMGGAVAGLVASYGKPVPEHLFLFTLLGTALFEIAVNFGSYGFDIATWLEGLSFTLVHFGSNLVFALLLTPFLPRKKD